MINDKVTAIFSVSAALLCGAVFGAAGSYNCKSYAVEMQVSDVAVPLTMVRQWNEKGGTYDETTKTWSGDWMDGDTTGEVSNQLGCCWLSVTMEKGKDYVIGVSLLEACTLMTVKKLLPTYTTFQQISYQGMNYLYIRAEDWSSFDPASVSQYIEYAGGKGSVNKVFSFVFRQCSIDDIIPAVPGTVKCPLDLDVSKAGETTIATSTERLYGRFATAYKASLKAGERYTFIGTYPSSDMRVIFSTTNWGAVPGTWANDPLKGKLVITVTQDYDFILLVMPDDANWEYGNVGGGSISWRLGEDPDPKPVQAGTYTGTVIDADANRKTARFSVVSEIIDDGTTNFTATVTVDGMQIDYVLNAAGELQGETTIGTKKYKSYFDVALTSAKTLAVDGSITLNDGVATEFFFNGILGGSVIDWNDSFLKHDATTESAAEMGITAGAFRNEPAGSATLVKVQKWGATCNVRVSDVNMAAFSETGDPTTLLAKAYLLNCPFDQEAVETAARQFVIIAFDPVAGVTVTGDRKAGDAYGNGCVEVRTAETPGGTYDTSVKPAGDKLFYKAYLVK